MRKDIDLFLTQMGNSLSNDLISHIVITYIYKDANIRNIQKQKKNKKLVCEELITFFGKCYNDRNILLYRNQQDQIILRNFSENNRFFLYSEREQQQTTEPALPMLLDSGHERQTEQNEFILFDNPTNEIVYDENGLPIQKKIKLYIMYI